MNANDDFRYLGVGLPEDILRRKYYGDFDGAIRLIDKRLEDGANMPEPLRACMRVERELISRLEADYPYTRSEALGVARAEIADFSEEEFDRLVEANLIDWIFVRGEMRYFIRFFSNLKKTDAAIAGRAGEKTEAQEDGEPMLDRAARLMRERGGLANRITIRASVRINDDVFIPGERALVHIPIPAACIQQSEIKLLSHTPGNVHIAPEDAPQRTISWEETMGENREFFVEYSYVNRAPYTDMSRIVWDKTQPSFFTGEEAPHIVFTPYIKALAAQLAADTGNPVEKAERIYDFVTKNVKYSYQRAYFGLENIAENCARSFRGDCGIQALLFITLCRAAGIPARWQSGLYAAPNDVGSHDWAMFYIAPHGWLFADLSFGGSAFRKGNEPRRKHYFGNLDPYRMVANSEFQRPFDPPKTCLRADPYDNQSGEIEFAGRGLRYEEYTREQTMTAYEEL